MEERVHKIGFIHGDFPFGGAERVTLDIAEYLKGKGYKVYVFTTVYHEAKMPAGTENLVEIVHLPEKNVVRSAEDADLICSYIKECGIDVIVAVAKRLKHIGKIRNTGCKVVYAHHNMPFHEAQAYIDRAWRKGRRNPLRYLEWLLISYPKYILFGMAHKKEENFYRESYMESDRYVMLVKEYGDAIVRRLGLDPSNNKVRVVGNSERVPHDVNFNKKKIILYVGRLSYADKRIDRLLKAWKLVQEDMPDWTVKIVGEGKERKSLEKMADRLDLQRVCFMGFTNNVRQYYNEASVLALVSTYEGFPLCITEAQANGVIPVVFDSFAAAETMAGPSGVNGFLVKSFDIKAFASALKKIASMPKEEITAMRQNVVKKAREEYSPEKIGEEWKKLFDELIYEEE